jgi:hypothetical protein
MSRKVKILLGIFIPIVVIGAGLGITLLTINWPVYWHKEPPVIELPFANSNAISHIWGYGDHNGEFHGGIDFIINTSLDIIAWCKLRVKGINTFQNEYNGFWQTNVYFQFSWKYEFEALFESTALNETYAAIQREAIQVKFGQVIEPGETIGTLLFFGVNSVIHFGAKESGNDVCAYQFFSSSAKATFLDLWNCCGYGDSSWYD